MNTKRRTNSKAHYVRKVQQKIANDLAKGRAPVILTCWADAHGATHVDVSTFPHPTLDPAVHVLNTVHAFLLGIENPGNLSTMEIHNEDSS